MLRSCWITRDGTLIECTDTWDHWNKSIDSFPDADDPENDALKAGWFKISGYSGNFHIIGQKMNHLQRRTFEEEFKVPADDYEPQAIRYYHYEFVLKNQRDREADE